MHDEAETRGSRMEEKMPALRRRPSFLQTSRVCVECMCA